MTGDIDNGIDTSLPIAGDFSLIVLAKQPAAPGALFAGNYSYSTAAYPRGDVLYSSGGNSGSTLRGDMGGSTSSGGSSKTTTLTGYLDGAFHMLGMTASAASGVVLTTSLNGQFGFAAPSSAPTARATSSRTLKIACAAPGRVSGDTITAPVEIAAVAFWNKQISNASISLFFNWAKRYASGKVTLT